MRLSGSGKSLFVLSILAVLLASAPLCGLDLPTRQIVDDSALRTRLKDSWFTEIPDKLLGKPPVLYTLDGGGRVQLRVEADRDEFMIILAR